MKSHAQRLLLPAAALLAAATIPLTPARAEDTATQPAAPSEQQPAPAPKNEGLFIHISTGTDSPQRLLMGLSLANKALAEGYDVFVFFDVKGIEHILQGNSEVTMQPYKDSRTLLKNLLDRGVPVAACPMCLRAMGREPADLIPGIRTATLSEFFSFTKGRILTLDY